MHAYLYPHVLPQSWLLNIYQPETICNEKISKKFYQTDQGEVKEKEIDESFRKYKKSQCSVLEIKHLIMEFLQKEKGGKQIIKKITEDYFSELCGHTWNQIK